MTGLSFEGCLAQRLRVTHASMGRLSVEMGANGLICAGVGQWQGIPPLMVIYDESTEGASIPVGRCVQELLPLLASSWRGLFPVLAATVVLRSADAQWDVAFVKWSQQGMVRRVDVAPIRWMECVARSEAAFVRGFGIQATRAMHMLFKMRASTLGSLST